MRKKSVLIVMGSDSDLPVMRDAADILSSWDIGYDIDIVSAHRTPQKLADVATHAHERGYEVIIAGAGGAAHLPGMVAAYAPLPVIGVPIRATHSLDGWDSLLSILQMPGGVPVATVAVNGAKNAAILAAQMLGIADKDIRQKVCDYKDMLRTQVEEKAAKLQDGLTE